MQDQLTLTALADSLRRRWWIAVLFLAAGAAVSIGVARRLPKMYRASTLIFVEPQKIPVAYVKPTITASVENRLKSIEQQIKSRSRIERVIQELGLFQDRIGKVPMERMVAIVARGITLEMRGTTTFRIHYEGTDPQEVARVANKVADLFMAENLEARAREARTTTEFLDRELEKVKVRLDAKEEALAEFKREHLGELPDQRDSNLRTLETLQNRLRVTTETLSRAKDRRLTLESQLAALPPAGTDVNQVAQQLQQARERLAQLRTQYTDQHPEVSLQVREVQRLEGLLGAEPAADPNAKAPATASVYEVRLRADIEAAELEIRNLTAEEVQIRADIVRYQQRVENATRNEAALSALMRDYDNLRANYQSLLNKKTEATLAENLERERQGEQFTVMDKAVPPAAPYKPNVAQIVSLGSVIGLLLGCAMAFTADLLRPRFRTEEELSSAYGIPVLASVPRVTTEEDRRRRRNLRRVLVGSGVAAALGALLVILVASAHG